jgi:hypothetical protein
MNDEIQRVISGKGQIRYGTNIQAAINYLGKSKKTGALDKTNKHFKREETDLNLVERFMHSNGFQKVRNNDYFNPELGIILEDLHDENVLTKIA